MGWVNPTCCQDLPETSSTWSQSQPSEWSLPQDLFRLMERLSRPRSGTWTSQGAVRPSTCNRLLRITRTKKPVVIFSDHFSELFKGSFIDWAGDDDKMIHMYIFISFKIQGI